MNGEKEKKDGCKTTVIEPRKMDKMAKDSYKRNISGRQTARPDKVDRQDDNLSRSNCSWEKIADRINQAFDEILDYRDWYSHIA